MSTPPPDLTEAERRLWALGNGPSAAAGWINLVMAEYDRRGAAEQELQRRLDRRGAVVDQLQADINRMHEGWEAAQLGAARSFPEAPTPAAATIHGKALRKHIESSRHRYWGKGGEVNVPELANQVLGFLAKHGVKTADDDWEPRS